MAAANFEGLDPPVQQALFEEQNDEAHQLPSPHADNSASLFTITCSFCGKPVDPESDTTYAEVRSWIHGAKKDRAVLRKYTGLYADSHCISLLRSGHHPSQKTLDETAEDSPVADRLNEALATDRHPEWLEGFADGIAGKSSRITDSEEYEDGYLEGEGHRDFGKVSVPITEPTTF
jgi:hypothetical protein